MDIVVQQGWRGLTQRQAQIASLILSGMTTDDVARALYLSAHTVKSHVQRVLKATGTSSRLELRNLLIDDLHEHRRLPITLDEIAQFLAVETVTAARGRHRAHATVTDEWKSNPAMRAAYRDRASRLVNFLGVTPRPKTPGRH